MEMIVCVKAIVVVASIILAFVAACLMRWREVSDVLVRDEARAEIREIGRGLADSAEFVGLDPDTVEIIGDHLAERGDLDLPGLAEEARGCGEP